MFVHITPVVLGLHVLIASPGGTPTFDVQKSCRESESAVVAVLGNTGPITYDNCVRQEKEAREQVVKDWATYPAADKGLCVQPTTYMPSYVEWLTCLEMRRDVRKMKIEEAASPKARTTR